MPVVLQVTDLHLGRLSAHDAARREVLRSVIAGMQPDLVVVTGDVCENPIDSPEEVDNALPWLDALGADTLVTPGNHDVGNKLSLGKFGITPGLFDHWSQHFGRGWARRDMGGWSIITLNTQIMGSGWPEEAEQLTWLEAQLASAERAAVFMHMPLDLGPNGDAVPNAHYWPIDPGPRDQLLPLLSQPKVRVLATGHLHHYASFPSAKPPRVWCPSSTFQVHIEGLSGPDADPTALGVIRHDLEGDIARHTYLPLDMPGVESVTV